MVTLFILSTLIIYIFIYFKQFWASRYFGPCAVAPPTQAQNRPWEIQIDITPQMRGILINWLIEVHLKFDLMQDTLYLMVTLLDFYLSVVVIRKTDMQSVGLTSLLLSSKYEDIWHPKVMELISISAETYTREQMLGLETKILKTLNFCLNLPTPYVFVLRFLRELHKEAKSWKT
uniref:Putative cyclin-like protein n=1 Tax=Helianthus annuus TaxID=4232 RepID=A0A251V2K4_HELAN